MRRACRLVMLLLADACQRLLSAEHACNIFAQVFNSNSCLSFGWGCSTVALRLHCRPRESPSSKLSTMVSHCWLNASGAHILSGLRFVRWQICSTNAGVTQKYGEVLSSARCLCRPRTSARLWLFSSARLLDASTARTFRCVLGQPTQIPQPASACMITTRVNMPHRMLLQSLGSAQRSKPASIAAQQMVIARC